MSMKEQTLLDGASHLSHLKDWLRPREQRFQAMTKSINLHYFVAIVADWIQCVLPGGDFEMTLNLMVLMQTQ